MIRYTEEQREQISAQAAGKTVESLAFEPPAWTPGEVHFADDTGYWVMTFTDGSEISFRFMAEMAP